MKRYWRIIGMMLAIILCIGTFYTRLALSESRLPSFSLNTQAGTKEAIGDFAINGEYISGNINYGLKIDKNGSHIINENSILTQLSNPLFEQLDLQFLQTNYRNFMRGKMGNLNNFYIDQNRVVYAAVNTKNLPGSLLSDNTLEVAILNRKDTAKTTHLSLHLNTNANFLDVKDVQFVGNKIKLVTNNFMPSGKNEVHLYSVDVSKKKIGDTTLFSVPGNTSDTAGNGPALQVITESNQMGQNYLVAVLVNTSKTKQPKLFVVNLVSSNKTEFPFPKAVANSSVGMEPDGETVNLTGTKFEFLKVTNKGLIVVPYDIMTRKQGQSIEIPFKNTDRSFPITAIKNDKLYILTQFGTVEDHVLIVKDLNTGKTLYKGNIKPEKGKLNSGQASLRLDSLDVQ